MNLEKTVIVVRAVFKFGNKYLLVKQINASGNEYLLFPGGHAKYDESLIVALKREILEELGISIFEVKKLIFVKETHCPFDKNFEFFFECKTSMKFEDIKIKQTKFTGYEHLKNCVLRTKKELEELSNFHPQNFFATSRYHLLKLDYDSYKKLFGNDKNIKLLNNEK